MAEAILSLSWKGYSSELSTVYKQLLENKFLVDCTISAEGQSLNAHRLVLSACSPYFHMLFREEPGKHPFVVLLDTSFATLKAVIDFMYRGEIQIPEGNLKAFLALAQSLQIKGLDTFTQDNMNKNVSSNTIGNILEGPSEDNQETFDVQGISNCHEESPHEHSHRSDNYGHSNSSRSFEEFSTAREEVQSTSVIPPSQEHQTLLGCGGESEDSEITVKPEPFYGVFLEPKHEILDNVKQNESTSEINGGTAFMFGAQNLSQYSSCNEPSHGNVEPSVMPPPRQLMQMSNEDPLGQDAAEVALLPLSLVPKSERMDDAEGEESVDGHALQVNNRNEKNKRREPAHNEQSLNEFSRSDESPHENVNSSMFPPSQQSDRRPLGQDVVEDHFLPEILGPQNEKTGDSGSEEPMDDRDVPEYNTNEKDGGTESASSEQILNKCSSAGNQQPEKSGTAERPSGRTTVPERRPAHWCQNSVRIVDGGLGRLAAAKPKPARKRLHRCGVCGMAFAQACTLTHHERTHTGERPFGCNECGKMFANPYSLAYHIRAHKPRLAHRCDVCAAVFSTKQFLDQHMLSHAEMRPHRCGRCLMAFAQAGQLAKHTCKTTPPRPWPFLCATCGRRFASPNTIAYHTCGNAAMTQKT